MKTIILTPSPVLTKPAQEVTRFDDQLEQILLEMKEALLSAKDPKGVGLAAPQIGYSLQIFAIKPRENSNVAFFVNPKIIVTSEEVLSQPQDNTPLEGCLSIPNTWGVVKRKRWVTISYQDGKGKRFRKTYKGFPAVIIQHELDHLKGILFTKRVLEQDGKLYEIVANKDGNESLKELPL